MWTNFLFMFCLSNPMAHSANSLGSIGIKAGSRFIKSNLFLLWVCMKDGRRPPLYFSSSPVRESSGAQAGGSPDLTTFQRPLNLGFRTLYGPLKLQLPHPTRDWRELAADESVQYPSLWKYTTRPWYSTFKQVPRVSLKALETDGGGNLCTAKPGR